MSDAINYTPFDGDGRHKVQPVQTLPCTVPTAVTVSAARAMIRRYVATGSSAHSGQAATLWVILLWCHTHGKPYVLKALPGHGYEVSPMVEAIV